MQKIEVQLYDSTVEHTFPQVGYFTFSNYDEPKKIKWVKNDPPHKLAIFTETHFDTALSINSKIKIAWLVESADIHRWAADKIKELENQFDYIFTHNKELLSRSDKYHQVYVGSSRISNEDVDRVFEKDRLVSIIASSKTMTAGHFFRHDIIKNIQGVDLWGTGYKYFKDKREPLANYMYSIAVMNAKYDYYFTEILIDCFMFKTIPIFYGCPNIGDIFDLRGMYTFDTIEELKTILDKISPEDYNVRLEYVNKNYEIAKNNFMITDDIIADKIKELGLDL
jgi:hypothetical protein